MKIFRTFFLSFFSALLLSSCAGSIQTLAPVTGSTVSLHTPIQTKYVMMSQEERRAYFADKACRKEMASEGFYPKPVTLAWAPCEECQGPYTVILSICPDFTQGTCREYTTDGTTLDVDNLRIATTYYWKVRRGCVESDVDSFVTEDLAPRLLRVTQLWNVRDLGGRVGLNGRRVKQDMVIRTGGLNNNATPINYTPEELRQLPEYQELMRNNAAATALLKNTPRVELPFLLEGEWIVFRPKQKAFTPEQISQAHALTEIPEEFMGVTGTKMTPNEQGGFIFNPIGDSLPVLLMKEFEAPEAGIIPFQCGADWYWSINVNGVVVYNRRQGNVKNVKADNYTLFLPVQKGRNLVVVPVGSGSGGFAWYCRPVPGDMSLDAVIASGLAENDSLPSRMIGVQKRDADGQLMYIPGKAVLDENGTRYLLEVLGLKSEIDLRSDGECYGMTGSPAGPTVTWYHISSSAYGGMQSDFGKKAFAKAFRIFLDEKNYPIDFHCIAGQDRTGSLAFILNALLGVSERELYLDWECTGFWNTSTEFRHDLIFDKLVEGFQKFPGDTIQQRVENYVLSLGFTPEDIQKFRDIMLE